MSTAPQSSAQITISDEKKIRVMAEGHGSMAVGESSKLLGVSNYYTWQLKMKAILRRENVWELTEHHVTPAIFPAVVLGTQYTENSMRKAKNLALSGIQLSVADCLLGFVANFTDPALCWEALRLKYSSGNQSHRLLLSNQLHALKMAEGSSMEDYVNRATDLKNKLLAIGDTVSDQTICQLLLNGLPRSYEGVVQTLSNLDTVLTFDQLSTRLLTEAARQEQRTSQLGDDEALVTHFKYNRMPPGMHSTPRGQYPSSEFSHFRGFPRRGSMSRGGRGRSPSRPQIICYQCGKTGHIARDCFSNSQPQRGYNNRSAYANAVENLEVAIAQLQDFNVNSPWYMDSGATTHVTGTKAQLTELTESSTGRGIRAAGGENHAVHGIGNASVNTESGAINMTNVLYVPSLKKSLMSVGALTDSGCLVYFSATNCYVLDNTSKHVIASGHRDQTNGLYRLTTVHEANSLDDEGRLWHRRYGHLSHIGLRHLISHNRVLGLPKVPPLNSVCEECLAGRQHR